MLLLSFHLLPVALLSLEGNLSVNFVHDLAMKLESSSGLLNAHDRCLHGLPGILEEVHESLAHHSLVDALADCVTSFLKLQREFSRQARSHCRLNRDDLVQTG